MVAGLKSMCWERPKVCELHSALDLTATARNVGKETVSAPLALIQARLGELHRFSFVSHGHSLKDTNNVTIHTHVSQL
jgi:hypothetical protein